MDEVVVCIFVALAILASFLVNATCVYTPFSSLFPSSFVFSRISIISLSISAGVCSAFAVCGNRVQNAFSNASEIDLVSSYQVVFVPFFRLAVCF